MQKPFYIFQYKSERSSFLPGKWIDSCRPVTKAKIDDMLQEAHKHSITTGMTYRLFDLRSKRPVVPKALRPKSKATRYWLVCRFSNRKKHRDGWDMSAYMPQSARAEGLTYAKALKIHNNITPSTMFDRKLVTKHPNE